MLEAIVKITIVLLFMSVFFIWVGFFIAAGVEIYEELRRWLKDRRL